MNNTFTLHRALIKNIEFYDIEKKLLAMQAKEIASYVVSVQRFDIRRGYHFLQPIYTSAKFQIVFEQLSQLTATGATLRDQDKYLLIRRDEEKNDIILVDSSLQTICLPMTLDQTKSMIKVLRAGGMQKTELLKKVVARYFFSPLNVEYILTDISLLSTFLEVKGEEESSVLDGLAALGIAVNRAVLNISLESLISRYPRDSSPDLLKFLL